MKILPEIHGELLSTCLDSYSWLTKVLMTPSMPPFSLQEPDNLNFLTVVAGFHTGSISQPTRARTMEFYIESATQFRDTLVALENVREWVTDDSVVDGAYFSLEKTHVNELYDPLDLKTSYPFHNLICRIATTYQIIRAHLVPRFQHLFISDFPLELLYMIISFLPDKDIPSFANTCRGLRLLCGHDRRLHSRLFFRMKYNMHALHTAAPPLQEDLYLDIIEDMIAARRRVTMSMKSLANEAIYTGNIRYISFDNEWDHKWPAHVQRYLLLPPATDTQIFEPFTNCIVNAIAQLPINHIRFVSLALTRRIVDHIARHPRIHRVTIERHAHCPALLETQPLAPKAVNVTYLAIGFHGDQYTHRTQWRLISMFPSLQHLYAYNCDVTEVSIRYPVMYGGMFHIHNLHTLHIEGSSRYIDALIRWITLAAAAQAFGVPGRLQRFKLQARKSIPHDEARNLVSVLASYHPHLRILVLEGLDHIYPDFAEFVSRSFAQLESLSLVRHSIANQRISKVRICDWNDSIFKYAEALRDCNSLRHLEINTLWPSPVLSPRLVDLLFRSLHSMTTSGSTMNGWERIAGGGPCDVTSIALPFAIHCRNLESFAVRSGQCYFSCLIHRHRGDGNPTFSDVRSASKHDRFQNWNPEPQSTWEPEN